MSQKKCTACGQWSNWNQSLADKCEHCGTVLERQRAEDTHRREENAKKPMTFTRKKIEKGDGLLRVMYKKGFNWTGAAYFGFLSFMMWLIAVVIH